TDKTSILCEAINYVKVLQERVKELEEPNKKSKESTLINLKTNEKSVVDVKARVLGNEVLIEMHCEKENGIELKILNHLQNLHLIVTASTVFPFGNSNLGFTIVAQMGDGYKLTVDDLVKTLQQVPLINMRRST
ncbi:transcription factor bHLH25-like protein, partial [Trifolium pratense]